MNAETEMGGADGLGGERPTWPPGRSPAEPGECVAVCAACGGDVVVPKAAGVPPRVEHEDDCPREGWTAQDASRYDDGTQATRYNYQPPAVVVDALAELRKEIGYSDGADDDETGGVDALIDYKNALEDRCGQLEKTLGMIGHVLPRNESWDGGPGRLEDIAEMLDAGLVERPNTSEYETH